MTPNSPVTVLEPTPLAHFEIVFDDDVFLALNGPWAPSAFEVATLSFLPECLEAMQDAGRGAFVAQVVGNFERSPNVGEMLDVAYRDGRAHVGEREAALTR